jgi:O-antigen/teichoic acid export membrane protein
LSKMVPLEQFGYYMLANVVASALQLFITPIFSVIFPRFSVLVAEGNVEEVRNLYHQGTQLMTVLILSVAIPLMVFAPAVIQLWTGQAEIGHIVAPIAILLVAGTAINGVMHLPYALQLSYGWTGLSVRFALVKILMFLPMLVWASSRYGVLGGAAVWAALNVCYMFVGVPLTHRRLLRGDALHWLFQDVGYPLVCALIVTVLYRECVGGGVTGWRLGLEVIGACALAALAAFSAAGEIRTTVLKSLFATKAFGNNREHLR